jgi:hypothetical protein
VAIGVPAGTLVERLVRGRVDSWRTVRGDLGVPGVSPYDGSTTGLSADGHTLVLAAIPHRYPPRHTRLAVLELRRFVVRVRARIDLPGFFTVDAISPDGRRLYLIHYTRPDDVLRYEVRAYDVPARRLLSKPIVDPREPGEKMQGTAATRAMSADGRWAYTLYVRPAGAPFIHALDTRAGTAACIDLDGIAASEATGLHLRAPRGGGPLIVAAPDGRAVRRVDRRTFAVSDAGAPRRPPAGRATADRGGGVPWGTGAALLAVLALAGLSARHVRSTRAKSTA